MADEQQHADTQTDAAPAVEMSATPTNGSAAGQQATGEGRTFSQAEVDRMIADRLERARHKAEQEAAKARSDAERKAAEEQGKYQELYEGLKGQLAQEQAARKALELSTARRDVAAKVGLPAALADRLQGDTPDEMEADAKAILAALPKPAAPNINATGGGPAPANGVSDDYRREMAARFGVPEKYFNVKGV